MSTSDYEQPLVPGPPLSLTPETPASSGKRIFIGPLGLRAGWAIALFLVLALLFGFGIGYLAVHATGRGPAMLAQRHQMQEDARLAKAQHTVPPLPVFQLSLAFLNEVPQATGLLLAAVVLATIERRRFRVYGLALRHLLDVLPGAGWGLVCMGALVALLRGLHLLSFDRRLLDGSAILRYGLIWLLFFFFVGLTEEFLFRGYIQFTLTRGVLALGRRISPSYPLRAAFWMSAIFWSLLFAAGHLSNTGENPAGILCVFGAGILFSYALWRTGSLWWGIGFHMTWDWSQSFLYGTPDSGTLSAHRLFQTHAVGAPLLSGGVDGPEGSVFVLLAFLIAFLALRLQPQAAQPPLEPESTPATHSILPEPIA